MVEQVVAHLVEQRLRRRGRSRSACRPTASTGNPVDAPSRRYRSASQPSGYASAHLQGPRYRFRVRAGSGTTMQAMRWSRAVAVALLLASGVAACSEDSSSSLPTPSKAFCQAAYDYDSNLPKLVGKIGKQTDLVAKLADDTRPRTSPATRRSTSTRMKRRRRGRHVGDRQPEDRARRRQREPPRGRRVQALQARTRTAPAGCSGRAGGRVSRDPRYAARPPTASLLRRFDRWRPSSTNSIADATPGRRLADLEVGEGATASAGHVARAASRTPTTRCPRRCARRDRSSNACDEVGELLRPRPGPERLEDRRLHDAVEHLLLAPVVDGLELDLARGARDERVEVAHARHHLGLAVAQRPPGRVGDQRLVVGDREPHRHARALVDVRRAARLLAHLGDDLGHERRHLHVEPVGAERPRLLLDDRGLELGVERVVRADLRAEAVLERRDDAAAVRVVLGVRRRHEHEVDRQADLVAADLHVALLEHVEQTDLDALGEVGELVDREDRRGWCAARARSGW